MNISTRIRAFDLLRGFSLILMVIIHILDDFGSETLQESTTAFMMYLIVSPLGAPLFVFVMGLFFQLSKNLNVSNSIKRGLYLILLGYLLNLFKGTIPTIIGLQLDILSLEDIAPHTPYSLFKTLDIFQFSGLALIFLSIVKRYLKHIYTIIILALTVVFLSPFLWDRMTPYPAINFILEMLWGNGENFNFPLFPWLFYPLSGMAYASFFAQSKDQEKFVFYSFFVGLLISFTAVPFLISDSAFILEDVHIFSMGASKPNIMFIHLGVIISAISVAFGLIKRAPENTLFNKLYFFSKHVTPFYVFQWLIIGWLNIEVADVSLIGAIIFFIIIILSTDRLLLIKEKLSI